ncbi:MAG: archease, partial [Bacteroidetes bacterium]|nr:archease [Bacteroidota bacterium]
MVEPFVVLEHPADIGIEAQGTTVEELFSNAARGMFTIMLGAYGTEKCLSFTV